MCLGGRLDRRGRANDGEEFMPSRIVRMSVMSLVLAGCVMPRATEGPLHTYLLSPEKGTWSTQPSTNRHEAHGVLLLSAPQAEAGFDTPRMVYLTRAHEDGY